ncbi:MAG TPA: ribonuclease D [Thermoanaerobaculia bacterium]|nr:ribonuclease D [Thermoanaerobaculia bacterium]
MKWIDAQPALDTALASVASADTIALDTEADSLHSYFDKVCLIQISVPPDDLLIDPLVGLDLAALGRVLSDRAVTKVLHGADYDLRILQRDFGFRIVNLVDTMVCAQLLGYEAFGLAALLERHFGVTLDKAHQRADWSMRPLPPQMLAYAATDTHYLIPLAEKLREELKALGRWEWAQEEFVRMEDILFEEKEDTEPWRRLKNIAALQRRSLAVLRDLHAWRDQLARRADRPPFKIASNEMLVEIARNTPLTSEDLVSIKSVSRFHHDRYSREILRITRRVAELPEDELPEKGGFRPWVRDRELDARVERMKKVRDQVAKELRLDPAVVAPRHVLTAIAALQPADVSQLSQVPAMREWQKRVLGEALVAAARK